LNLEDKYLKLLVPNYNILTEAGSSFGYKHTEIDRQKMKDIYSDASTLRVREIIGNLNKGKKFSRPLFNVVGTETIERMREKALIRPPNPRFLAPYRKILFFFFKRQRSASRPPQTPLPPKSRSDLGGMGPKSRFGVKGGFLGYYPQVSQYLGRAFKLKI
jgi:hypothetical protein